MKKAKVSEILTGTVTECTIRPAMETYQFEEVAQELMETFQFEPLGQGGFGLILGGEDCVIKLIKDVQRCNELEQERRIYQIIDQKRQLLDTIEAKIPTLRIFSQLADFVISIFLEFILRFLDLATC